MSGDLSVMDPASDSAPDRTPESYWSGWSDWAGMVASIGCAIHCAAMPFVIAYLPALGLSFLADEAFHQWMAVGCFAIALTAFVPGLRKHGRLTPVIVGSVGLVMISIAAFGLAGECCTSCHSTAASAGLVSTGLHGNVAPPADSEDCSDECCAHCASDSEATGSPDASTPQLSSDVPPDQPWTLIQLVTRIAPWLTPIGGIVLVTAHLLNHRYGCLCGCCENESATGNS